MRLFLASSALTAAIFLKRVFALHHQQEVIRILLLLTITQPAASCPPITCGSSPAGACSISGSYSFPMRLSVDSHACWVYHDKLCTMIVQLW